MSPARLRSSALALALVAGCGYYPFDPATPKTLAGVRAKDLAIGPFDLFVLGLDGTLMSVAGPAKMEGFPVTMPAARTTAIGFVGDCVIVAGDDGNCLFDAAGTADRYKLPGPVTSVARAGSGYLYVAADGSAAELDAATQKVRRTLAPAGAARKVAAGEDAACLLLRSGEVQCAPITDFVVGDFTTKSGVGPATDLAAATYAWSSSSGTAEFCAVVQEGRVSCWGNGAHGQLGAGVDPNQAGPVLVTDDGGEPLAGVTAVALDGTSACAIGKEGKVWCWGDSSFAVNHKSFAGEVAKVRGATALALGGLLECAVVKDGTIACWGDGKSVNLDGAFFVPYIPN